MSIIQIDGLNEEDFRRSIENRLREGRADAAIERLRPLLMPYAAPGGLLPERFLTIQPEDLVLTGWDGLHDAVRRRDMPGRRITAISIAFAWPEGDAPAPDEEGRLRPHVETGYYSDNAYPFSQSGREDLLEGYSFYGCAWNGDCEASDTTISVEGIDDLHGALASLEARLLASEEPDEDGIRAGSLGACLLSALLIEAVNQRVTRDGTPRPLCVMAGSYGIYPYFDAPVAGMPDAARKQAEEDEEEEVQVAISRGVPTPRYSSLLMTGIPRARKRAVLVLEPDNDLADRLAQLRHLGHGEDEAFPEAVPEPSSEALADPVPAGAPALPATEPLAADFLEPDPAADILPAAIPGSPLLVKKHARHGQSLHELLGLEEPTEARDLAPPLAPGASETGHEGAGEPPRRDDWGDWDSPGGMPPNDTGPAPFIAPAAAPGFNLLGEHAPSWSHDLLVARPLVPAREPVLPDAPEQMPPVAPALAEPAPLSLRERLCTEPAAPPRKSHFSRLVAWLAGRFGS